MTFVHPGTHSIRGIFVDEYGCKVLSDPMKVTVEECDPSQQCCPTSTDFESCCEQNPNDPNCQNACEPMTENCICDENGQNCQPCDPSAGECVCETSGQPCQPIYGPPMPPENRAHTAGEPHLVTLDGLAYDFQAWGDFDYLLSDSPTKMAIQVRQEPYEASSRPVTMNTAVAMSVLDDKVEIYLNKEPHLYVNGSEKVMTNPSVLSLEHGGEIYVKDNVYYVVWPDNNQVKIWVGESMLDVYVALSNERKGYVKGLVGNFDGKFANDLMTRDGSITFKTNLTKDELYGSFGNSWRVSQEDSLFTYAPDKPFDPDFPEAFISVDDLTSKEYEDAKSECKQAGITDPILLDACILDFALTGKSEFINSAINATVPLKRVNDGLIADLPFDGNANDKSGMGYHGTVNGATLTTEGYNGQAYQFDGTNDYIEVPLNINPDVMPQLTMGAWVKATDGERIQQIFSHDNRWFDRSLGIDERVV